MAPSSTHPTPCFVVFDFLKREAGVNYKDFAMHLFNKEARLGKVPLLTRLEDKTFMSRQVVRLEPGSMSVGMFDDFASTATFAWNALKGASGNSAYKKLIDVAVPQMVDSLRAFELKDKSFMNVVVTVANMPQLTEGAKGSLIMLLFIAAGCTGDVSFAIDKTIEQMNAQGATMRTAQLEETADFEPVEVKADDFGLTLFRIKNGVMVTPGFDLFDGEEGNEIGLLPEGSHVFADVEKTVSRRHLKVWKADDGRWLVKGLNSKNGTVKLDAGTMKEVVVELSRNVACGVASPEVEIAPGDHLILGQDTEFIVCKTLSN